MTTPADRILEHVNIEYCESTTSDHYNYEDVCEALIVYVQNPQKCQEAKH